MWRCLRRIAVWTAGPAERDHGALVAPTSRTLDRVRERPRVSRAVVVRKSPPIQRRYLWSPIPLTYALSCFGSVLSDDVLAVYGIVVMSVTKASAPPCYLFGGLRLWTESVSQRLAQLKFWCDGVAAQSVRAASDAAPSSVPDVQFPDDSPPPGSPLFGLSSLI
ncbi:hypothetical protein AK812_SmicGene42320 [Symbiodinium microadriaticum]|uniref:Uncharacterized protein n=1 Tax=Symbiodinium microadriaticum TaxID=2951 RepID=A0A1Q9C3X5_SYMMI|nr:hypothetical protein AK812_SmicGene42320 [Symbiodinium microadriaticum]